MLHDVIYKKIQEQAKLRYGGRNQDSGFWVRAVVDWKGAKGKFLGKWKSFIA